MDIILKNLCKSYGPTAVLRDFSHLFPEGRISCILGPSGCGKTTLLRLIAGLESPDSGSISGTKNKKISAVLQENRLFEDLSARKNVLLTARPGFTTADAEALLFSLGLPIESKPVSRYSGGMQRRTAIARALAADFDLLLLDEPLTGLDSDTRRSVIEVIQKHIAGKTCVWVTHDADTAAQLSKNLLKMEPE